MVSRTAVRACPPAWIRRASLRPLSAPPPRPAAAAGKKTIKVTFVKPSGDRVTVDAPVGDSMLEVAHANNIDIEGACWGGRRVMARGCGERLP